MSDRIRGEVTSPASGWLLEWRTFDRHEIKGIAAIVWACRYGGRLGRSHTGWRMGPLGLIEFQQNSKSSRAGTQYDEATWNQRALRRVTPLELLPESELTAHLSTLISSSWTSSPKSPYIQPIDVAITRFRRRLSLSDHTAFSTKKLFCNKRFSPLP